MEAQYAEAKEELLGEVKEKTTTITVKDFTPAGVRAEYNQQGEVKGRYNAIHIETVTVLFKPDGTAENWALEGGTPNVLFRRGFTKESLLPGTEIVIDGYQAKDGSKRANGRNLTLPNGKMLFLGSSGTGAPNELTPENQKK